MNLHVFTTGRGTAPRLAGCPVIQVATAASWHGALGTTSWTSTPGRIASGEATIEEDIGWELFRSDARGRQRTQASQAEHWKLANALVLFNPRR